MHLAHDCLHYSCNGAVWIEEVSIAPPRVPDRDTWSTERKLFPAEVSDFRGTQSLTTDV